MRPLLLLLLVVSALLLLGLQPANPVEPPAAQEVEEAQEAVVQPEPPVRLIEERFPRNSTLQEVLLQHGLEPAQIHRLIQETQDVYNLNRVRAGNRLQLGFLDGGQLKSLLYEISDEEFLNVLRNEDRFTAELGRHEFDTRVSELSAVMPDSLYNTLKRMGEGDQLVADLLEVLQWDVDFTALQAGDWFKLIVEKKFRDEEFVKYGRILAVQFNTGGRDIYAFRFANPETGVEKFFDAKGGSVRKAFLKVPFRYHPRISSGFSYSRFHPILKKRRPHLALDYAAPRGTAVLASASGRVVLAGWNGGFGKHVKIRHANGYTTGYAHLSRILVKVGQNVEQGQTIGRVGSTGLATAAHLDYRIQDRRGRYLNPRKRIQWPSDKPLDERYWSEFVAVRDVYLEHLASLAEPAAGNLKAD